jgi:hypothetical protein
VKRHLGTGRDTVTPLDWQYRAHPSIVRRLPAIVDLRRQCPPVYGQLHLNSCSANAIAAAPHYDELREGRPDVPSPSRLFIDCNERVLAGRAVFAVGYQPARRLIDFCLTCGFWTMRRVS